MRSFRELTEKAGDTAVFTFGRFNPPTIGHEKLVNAVAKQQSKNAGSKMYVYASQSNDPKKNPLPYAKKIAYMRKMFKKYSKNIVTAKPRTAIEVAVELYNKGHKAIVMVVGSDRVTEFETLLNEYNGVEGKRHGYYGFDNIEVISAGERDPDAEGVEGMSASKMRDAAEKGDFDSFKTGIPDSMSDADKKKMYFDVRKGQGIREEREMGNDYDSLRDAYLTGKIWNVGEAVEAKGLTGEVVRKGTNYLSFVAEDGKVHKAWLHEIELDEDASVYKKTARKNKSGKSTFAFGRRKKLDGQPKEKGGYFVWKLSQNYDGKVKGGIRNSWAQVAKDLSYSDAVKLMNKKLGRKEFKEEVELDEGAEEIKKLEKMLKDLEKRKKKTPGDGFAKIKIRELIADLKNKKEDVELDERNYAKEYQNYQGTPEQIARRSSRNKARRAMGDKAVKGMDVGHADNDPMNNDPKNLRMEKPSDNRREPRLREKPELDEVWFDDLAAKISQITHPRGWGKMVKHFAVGMKNPEHRKHPTAWAGEVAKEYRGVTGRQLVKYINKLVDKGELPKELKAEVQHESFKSFIDSIQVQEVLGSGASQKDYIDDFIDSDAPQFKGKSKKERIAMAIAAFRSKN